MAATDSYFQFPLCLLAYGPDVPTRLHSIVDFCIAKVGRRITEENRAINHDERNDKIVTSFSVDALPVDFQRGRSEHREIIVGMHVLGAVGGSIATILKNYQEAAAFCDQMRRLHGGWPYVRIRTEYIWEVINGNGMTYRELAVLCALYSVIGAKDCAVRITRDRLRAGALGYKSASVLFDKGGMLTEPGRRLLETREDGAQPLSVDQIRATLDRLEANHHFVRCQAGKRQVYFSHRMSRDEMAEKIFAQKTRQSVILAENRRADRDLQTRIKVAKKSVANHSPAKSPL